MKKGVIKINVSFFFLNYRMLKIPTMLKCI